MRILYVDCDSLRPDHLGCYGYDRDTSPVIDGLAEEGRRFTNYYASDVPCLPSRTALFTGRFGIHTGVVGHGGTNATLRTPGERREFTAHPDFRTFPVRLRDAGYRTAFVSSFPQRHGAWHVLDGFETWVDPGGKGRERADAVFDRAVPWLRDHAAEDDWYCHVNFWDPHTPYDTPESYGDPFADVPAPDWPPEATVRDHYASYGPHGARELHGWGPNEDVPRAPPEVSSREAYEEWIDGYDTGIRFMDDHVGKLLGVLEEAGVREETLVVVSADHGENQGELNVYGDHHTADDRTCRVPLIASGPGVDPGVDDGLRYGVDLAPTLAELTGTEAAAGWDGRSFAGALTGDGGDDGREFLVLGQGAWACQRGVRWDDWLLVRTYHDGLKEFPPVMLFDLGDDPHETDNLARDRPDAVRRGLSLLESWHADRMREAATGRAGGNPDAADALTDPLWEVVREGGPYHVKGRLDAYLERLRETGREGHAETLRESGGLVTRSVESYLDGDGPAESP